jgi:transcriptional regulator with XRE-family HTH domain
MSTKNSIKNISDNDSLRALIAAIKDGSVGFHYDLPGQKEAAIARLTYKLELAEAKDAYSEAIIGLRGEQGRQAIRLGESLQEAYRLVSNSWHFIVPEVMDMWLELSIETGIKYGACKKQSSGTQTVLAKGKNQVAAKEAFAALAADMLGKDNSNLSKPVATRALATTQTADSKVSKKASEKLMDGKTFKLIREKMQMTQAQFAAFLNQALSTKISRSTIAMYETGKRRTVKLSKALGELTKAEKFKESPAYFKILGEFQRALIKAILEVTAETKESLKSAIKDTLVFFNRPTASTQMILMCLHRYKKNFSEDLAEWFEDIVAQSGMIAEVYDTHILLIEPGWEHMCGKNQRMMKAA